MSFTNSFRAFGGKLDSSIFQLTLDSQGNPDLKAAALTVAGWIGGLRRSPESYGIPKERTRDVSNLVNKFFPEPPKGHPIEPVRIDTDVGFRDSLRRIIPTTVSFGPSDGKILIADATNALAYIFTMSTPSVSQPTFANYYLPLTVCYAWFTYLLFLSPSSSPTFVITNVPSEVCVQYLPDATIPPQSSYGVFCLGATWAGVDPPNAYGSGAVYDNESAYDQWRYTTYIEPTFARNPAASVPDLAPRVKVLAARRLNEYILGKKGNNSNVTPFLDSLFTGLLPGGDKVGLTEFILAISATIMLEAKQPGIPTVPDFLVSHTKLSPKLMSLLFAVLDASRNLSDMVKLQPAFASLIEFYITPHVFDLLGKTELPLGSSKVVISGLAASLPIALLPVFIKKLQSLEAHLQHNYESTDDHIRYIQTLYWIDEGKPYVRGPETFPVYSLSSQTFGKALSNTELPKIRGAKLKVRALGQAITGGAFKTEFSSAELDNATFQTIETQMMSDPVIGPPDAENQILLQEGQMRGNDWLSGYSSDAQSTCPKTFALFNPSDSPLP